MAYKLSPANLISCLRYLKWYHVYADNSQKIWPAAPLRFIKDINDVDQLFPADIDQLTEKYPIDATQDNETRKNNQDHIYATVLFRLSKEIAAMFVSPRTNTTEQEEASNRFESRFQFTIPKFDLEVVPLPNLGPRMEFEEAELERYSRVNVLIKSLQTFLMPTKKVTPKSDTFEKRRTNKNGTHEIGPIRETSRYELFCSVMDDTSSSSRRSDGSRRYQKLC